MTIEAQKQCLVCLVNPHRICRACGFRYCGDHWYDTQRRNLHLPTLPTLLYEKFPSLHVNGSVACISCWETKGSWTDRFELL